MSFAVSASQQGKRKVNMEYFKLNSTKSKNRVKTTDNTLVLNTVPICNYISVIFVFLSILLLLIYQFRWFQRLLSCLHIHHPSAIHCYRRSWSPFKVVTQMALNQEPKTIDGFQLCLLLDIILYY